MNEGRQGKVVTFYSYKGGTGRTMALANVAWILAANGKRVLVADWDLESPGLHRFFHPFLDAAVVNSTAGIIDMIRAFEWQAIQQQENRELDWHRGYARVLNYAVSLEWEFPGGGTLDYLSAGRANRDYSAAVASLDWDNFYERLGGGQFFDALRENMQDEYDYALIDSRTGLTDVADICTLHLPDTLVTCFTLSDQGIEGAASVARDIEQRYSDRGIRILPVPTRIDDGEKERADAGRALARHRFDGLPANMAAPERNAYWGSVEVPYRPFYAYEETLATFGDQPGMANSLLSSFERLTAYITEGEVSALPRMEDARRLGVLERYVRRSPRQLVETAISHVPEDRVWAEWVAAALGAAGVTVRLVDPQEAAALLAAGTRVAALLSPAYVRAQPVAELDRLAERRDPTGRLGLLHFVEVADIRLSAALVRRPVLRVHGLPTEEAALQAVVPLVDPAMAAALLRSGPRLPRFPGRVPSIWNTPARNANFTGRTASLEQLRDRLSANSVAVVLPVALHGLGGVGKTQIALEYVHRFKSDYDLVWWVNAENPDLVSVSLAQLAEQLGITVGSSATDAVKEVLRALRQGEPTKRWLVVFDNAEEPAAVQRFLPQGEGHLLITTRDQAWTPAAGPLEVDVFARAESVEYLCRRTPGLTPEDADAVAEQVGDLPLAVEVAAAWLSETGTPVATYLDSLAHEATQVLSLNTAPGYPHTVAATWNISLRRLAERSPAALRMLQICAFMAPEISLNLLNGRQMGEELRSLDESQTDPLLRGRLVQELVRLGLAKINTVGRSLQVHRLLQAAIRDPMTKKEREDLEHAAHLMLAAARPGVGDTDDPDTWPVYETIWPHLEPSRARDCAEQSTRQLYTDQVRYLRQIGNSTDALNLSESLAEQWTEELRQAAGPKEDLTHSAMVRRNLLHLQFQIANNYRALGRYTDALNLDSEVLEQQTEQLGADHPHTLMTASGLAADLRAAGRYSEALALDLQTVERVTEALGDDNPRSLMATNNLAVSYRLVGDSAKAREIDESTLQLRRARLGAKHPHALFSADHLGRDLRETGDYKASIELLTDTLATLEEVLGLDALSTIETRSSLAVSLRKVGRTEEALRQAELSHERAEQTARGGRTINTNACALNLATCASAIGDHQRAVDLVRPVQEWYDQHLGPEHPYALLCHISMAISLRGLERSDAALAEAEHAHTGLTDALGAQHRFTLSAAVTLANCYADRGDPQRAEALEREALRAFTALLGPEHPDTLACLSNLAVSLLALGQKQEARVVREQAVNQLTRRLGADHRNTVAARTGARINLGLEAQPI